MQVPYAHFLGGRDTTWEPKGSKRVVVDEIPHGNRKDQNVFASDVVSLLADVQS